MGNSYSCCLSFPQTPDGTWSVALRFSSGSLNMCRTTQDFFEIRRVSAKHGMLLGLSVPVLRKAFGQHHTQPGAQKASVDPGPHARKSSAGLRSCGCDHSGKVTSQWLLAYTKTRSLKKWLPALCRATDGHLPSTTTSFFPHTAEANWKRQAGCKSEGTSMEVPKEK